MNSRPPRTTHSFGNHRGRPILVFFCGLILGLSIAVAVGIYITRVPTPTPLANDKALNDKNADKNADRATAKMPPQSSDNLNESNGSADSNANLKPLGDPNGPLYGKPPSYTPAAPPASVEMIASQETPNPTASPSSASPAPPAGKTSYVLQVAAYSTPQEAEQQKAKLALQGFDAKVSAHEVSGVKYFRVRLGPFDKMEDAQTAKDKLHALRIETLLIKANESKASDN